MSIYTPSRVGLVPFDRPDDGDDVTAASVGVALEALADGILAISPPVTLSLSPDRVRLMRTTASSPGPSPALASLGTLVLPVTTEVANSDSQLGVLVALTTNPMTGTMTLYLPLDELLHYHGYTIASCKLKVKGAAGHGGLPGGMPRISLVRFGASANAGLHSTTWVLDTAANVAAYEVEHDITLTPDQNAVIDCEQYQYALLVQNEYGANVVSGLQFRRIVLTLTAPT